MEQDNRLIPQGDPTIPPEDPPESKVPNKSGETGNVANYGAGNDWNKALSDEEAAAFIAKYGLKAYLMWLMLHGIPIGQDH